MQLFAAIAAITSPTEQKTQNVNWALEFIKIVGPFVAGYYAHILITKRESTKRVRDAKDEFLDCISHIRANIDKRNVLIYYRDTKQKIKEAVCKLSTRLEDDERMDLETLWIAYDKMDVLPLLNQKYEDELGLTAEMYRAVPDGFEKPPPASQQLCWVRCWMSFTDLLKNKAPPLSLEKTAGFPFSDDEKFFAE